MFDSKKRFVIEQYQKKPAFSSFLPGISGRYGIPVWSFYVNRGQGIASFGVRDKDHSILEFSPAHQAYQVTKNMGFRTFLKVNGKYYEPFHSGEAASNMYISGNMLELEEIQEELGIKIHVLYYTLPNEKLGGLVRKVEIENCGKQSVEIEMLDGLPAIIPYGVALDDLKKMGQTMKAWMQVEDISEKKPYYRVRYSTKDSAEVAKIKEGNFMLAFSQEGELLPIIGDSELVFEYDTSFELPEGFLEKSLEELNRTRQNLQNQVPCGFSSQHFLLGGGESRCTHAVIGQAVSKRILHDYAKGSFGENYFKRKQEEAESLVHCLMEKAEVKTANPVFDAYCGQTYLDNILRGGYPVKLGKEGVFYLYSRKHGDLERDYNFFTMLPEFYSQGNGNFRDVNQNRRSDVLFAPFIKDYNIKMFYNLIQLDGYNPLVVQQLTYRVLKEAPILDAVLIDGREILKDFLKIPFSPGQLFTFMEENAITLNCDREVFLDIVADHCVQEMHADFAEGYWTDHWTYNLDLVESYLSVYPEKEEKLLFSDRSYTYFAPKALVNPRHQRYERTEHGVRQCHFVTETAHTREQGDMVRTQYGTGEVYESSLMTKLTVIAANKVAALDMYGMGIEMEAGKPGWYDALNGLPGIFGSSMSEAYELQRLLTFMEGSVEKHQREFCVPGELYDFILKLETTIQEYYSNGMTRLLVWNHLNTAKEKYRSKIAAGISGEEQILMPKRTLEIIKLWNAYLSEGIASAVQKQKGMPPTYYTCHFEDYTADEMGVMPDNPSITDFPDFLEGPVHYLKLLKSREEKQALYGRIKSSGLYDKKLGMYKVNDSLEEVSFEAGRAKAFSPGWLENESIWLHMEYKYLLEILRAGLYREFFTELKQVSVPFMDYEKYGRSPLENSSFIVSSANDNEKLWGRGFVSRLSGATAEFLQILSTMLFGESPFYMRKGELVCAFAPAIPAYLIPEDGKVEGTFLGKTRVVYAFGNVEKDIIPGAYSVSKIWIRFQNGEEKEVLGGILAEPEAKKLREGEVERMVLDFHNCH